MPWKCPGCQTEIRHVGTRLPNPEKRYRCHQCRLEMKYDLAATQMVIVAPVDETPRPKRKYPKP